MDEIMKTYAGNIRRARQNKKVTQAVMADKIGISEKYWSDIETGRKLYSLDTLGQFLKDINYPFFEISFPKKPLKNRLQSFGRFL